MGLRFDPVGGGQFQQLVAQLIDAERQPVRNLENRKAIVQARLDLFQSFKTLVNDAQGSLQGLRNFRDFRELQSDVGDAEELVEVSLDKTRARPGNYKIEIESLAEHSAIISNGFEDATENNLGIGYIVVHTADESYEVFVDEENASLRGIARLINDVKDSPIQAEVIRDEFDPDNPFRLIVKAKKDGYFNAVEFPDIYLFGGRETFYIEDEIESDNAFIKIDGFEIEAASNDIPDFFEGVNLRFKEARPGKPFTLSISVDNQAVAGKVKEFVEKMNQIMVFINEQNQIDENTDTRTTFAGDTSLQTVEYRLRNLFHEGFPVTVPGEDEYRFVNLSELGIGFNRSGEITFDENKFNQRLEDDFELVSEVFTGEFGFGFQMQQVINQYTRPLDGLLAVRERGMRSQIDNIDRNIENQERRIDRRAQALTNRFARLQSTLGSLQQQQQYVQATLGASGGNILTQLLG